MHILYDGDDVCGICKHEYLVPSEDYFIGKCKKGHKECSKEDIKYCEDFRDSFEECEICIPDNIRGRKILEYIEESF